MSGWEKEDSRIDEMNLQDYCNPSRPSSSLSSVSSSLSSVSSDSSSDKSTLPATSPPPTEKTIVSPPAENIVKDPRLQDPLLNNMADENESPVFGDIENELLIQSQSQNQPRKRRFEEVDEMTMDVSSGTTLEFCDGVEKEAMEEGEVVEIEEVVVGKKSSTSSRSSPSSSSSSSRVFRKPSSSSSDYHRKSSSSTSRTSSSSSSDANYRAMEYQSKFTKLRFYYDNLKKEKQNLERQNDVNARAMEKMKAANAKQVEDMKLLKQQVDRRNVQIQELRDKLAPLEKAARTSQDPNPVLMRENKKLKDRVRILEAALRETCMDQLKTFNVNKDLLEKTSQTFSLLFPESSRNTGDEKLAPAGSLDKAEGPSPLDPRLISRK